jgi:hypothetical protein
MLAGQRRSHVPMEIAPNNPSTDLAGQIRSLATDPAALENLFQAARHQRQAESFGAAIDTIYQEQPENLLFGAWHYRLRSAMEHARAAVSWPLAIGLSMALGLIFWVLSGNTLGLIIQGVPYLVPLIGPLTVLAIMTYLTFAGGRAYLRFGALAAVVVALGAYAAFVAPLMREQYNLPLPWLHVPVVAVACLGVLLVGWHSPATERFAFLAKALEVFATAGVFLVVGGIFIGITVGLFAALRIDVPPDVARLFVVGVGGFVPVIAVLNVYNPALPLSQQEFGRGFARIIAVLLRVMLALALIVMVIYLIAIPFNFSAPFEQRDVLIIYNVLLFAVMGLLVGVTPMDPEEVSEQWRGWLRGGITALVALVLLVSLYALAAAAYRLATYGVSANRVAVIGWNVINIGILIGALVAQARGGRDGWARGIRMALGMGVFAYVAWSAFVALALPWIV